MKPPKLCKPEECERPCSWRNIPENVVVCNDKFAKNLLPKDNQKGAGASSASRGEGEGASRGKEDV